jgi:hypothetical protein
MRELIGRAIGHFIDLQTTVQDPLVDDEIHPLEVIYREQGELRGIYAPMSTSELTAFIAGAESTVGIGGGVVAREGSELLLSTEANGLQAVPIELRQGLYEARGDVDEVFFVRFPTHEFIPEGLHQTWIGLRPMTEVDVPKIDGITGLNNNPLDISGLK